MEAKELLGFKKDDLVKRSKELAEELFNTRLQNISGSLENTSKIRDIRRNLARVKTVLNQMNKKVSK